ncbi:hypothetical protein L915_20168, partial [Phytophthora nicotianae]
MPTQHYLYERSTFGTQVSTPVPVYESIVVNDCQSIAHTVQQINEWRNEDPKSSDVSGLATSIPHYGVLTRLYHASDCNSANDDPYSECKGYSGAPPVKHSCSRHSVFTSHTQYVVFGEV